MTVVIPATAQTSFEIKSANLLLVSLLLKSDDLSVLEAELAQRFGDIPDFFDNDLLVIDLAPLQNVNPDQAGQAEQADQANDSAPDFAALLALLRSYRLQPIAAKGGSPAQMAAALVAGLFAAPDAHLLASKQRTLADDAPPSTAMQAAPMADTAAQSAAVHPMAAAAQGALIIDKPLRSGQQVYARGRDLVVLAMVNQGAEVIADGNIHVYAPLRGKAMAGARGNTDARIFSLELDAELLSIAGVYRTSETPLPASVKGQPTQVRLVSSEEGDKLVMDRLE